MLTAQCTELTGYAQSIELAGYAQCSELANMLSLLSLLGIPTALR